MSTDLNSAHIVFVGCGKMGEALLGGWIASGEEPANQLSAKNFSVVEHSEERQKYIEDTYGVLCVSDVRQLRAADIVILAVKPQVLRLAVEQVSGLEALSKALYVSIAAGVETDTLVDILPKESRLVRVMPNLPLVVGAGASVVCRSATSNDADVDLVRSLFSCLGIADIVDESLMDAACALSGSGPAYVAAMIESLVKAGVSQGLPRTLADSLALQTVLGTALQLTQTEQSPEELRKAVSSPGGTTVAALAAMEVAGFDNVFSQGVAAAVQRSKELASCQQ
ncbi:MAG: pyrroline-5-carboxylate reductase [Raoultibacter sp.]|jgi:pyrroline-5-carboxylate reductase